MKVLVRSLFIATVGLCHAPGAFCAQDNIEPQASNLAQSLVRQHEAWMKAVSTPGASASFKESGRGDGNISYRLFVTGLPKDLLYTVVEWPVTKREPVTLMEGVSLGTDGLVSCTGRLDGECNDPDPSPSDRGAVDFAFRPQRGEPFRIAVMNGGLRAAAVVVPLPIEAKNKSCTIQVVRLTPRFELAYVTGTGYQPNTQISFDGESFGENHPGTTTADGEGRIRFAILPFVAGHARGTTTLRLKGETCSPSLKFDWGLP